MKIFENIFDFAKSSADADATSQTNINGYLPVTPNESVSVPQHDPSQPTPTATQQDPKIVRETEPPLAHVFSFISDITGSMKSAPDKQDAVVSDPSSVTDPSEGIMKQGQDAVKKVAESVTKPSAQRSDPPTPPTPPAPPKAPTTTT